MTDFLNAFMTDESGQDLAEYGLLLALITVAVVGLVIALGDGVESMFSNANSAVQQGVEAGSE